MESLVIDAAAGSPQSASQAETPTGQHVATPTTHPVNPAPAALPTDGTSAANGMDAVDGSVALPHVVVSDDVFGGPGYRPLELYSADTTTPVIASCPHAGRSYPAALLRQAAQSVDALRGLEDFGVDCLVAGLPEQGVSLLMNRVARGYLDVNRDVTALDADMFAGPVESGTACALVRAGYGLMPRLTAGRRPIYEQTLPSSEANSRILAVHTPYHTALQTLVDETVEKHGFSLLVDFHSMPAHDRMNNRLPDIICGDVHGTTLDRQLARAIARHLREAGLSVSWNHPYAGGHITRHYGDARTNQQSVQIEVNRAIYMDGPTRLDAEKTARMRQILTGLAGFLVGHLAG